VHRAAFVSALGETTYHRSHFEFGTRLSFDFHHSDVMLQYQPVLDEETLQGDMDPSVWASFFANVLAKTLG
jgi:hypothetical protein